MISYRIRFTILCRACNQMDKWNIAGMGQNHADWIEKIAAAGETEWTCTKCQVKSKNKVMQAEYELEVKR